MPPTAAAPGGPAETRWQARRRRLDELAASVVGLTADGVTVRSTNVSRPAGKPTGREGGELRARGHRPLSRDRPEPR